MANNFLGKAKEPTTQPNPHSMSVRNHANQHDSPSGVAASDASNSNEPRRRASRNFTLFNCGGRGKRTRLLQPRMHRRLGILHPRHGWNIFAVLIVFLAPFSSASLPDIQFGDARILGGSTSSGEFAGIYLDFPANDLTFSVSGQHSISTEYREEGVSIGLTAVVTDQGHEAPISFDGISKVSVFESGEIFLGAKTANAGLESNNADVIHHRSTKTWDRTLAEEPTNPAIPSKNSINLLASEAGEFHISGDFTFSLWNSELETTQGTHWAGQRANEFVSGAPIGAIRSQLLHVTITNGTLTGNFAGTNVETYWKSAALEGEGELLIQSATNLAGVNIGEIRLEDDWSLNVQGGEQLTATGLQASGGNVAGTTIQPDTTSWLWWLLAAPFVILAALIIRPPPRVIVRRMERDLEAGRYLQVAGYRLTRILRSKYANRASLYRATSLLAMEQYQEAGLFLKSINPEARPDPATYHLLYANALAGIGSKEEAAKELAACITLVPSYAKEAALIPLLKPLLSRAYAASPDYA